MTGDPATLDRRGILPVEVAPAAEMGRWQAERLREQLAYVAARSPFYAEAFRSAGVAPDDLHTLDDLRRFPLTTKDDLREHASDFVCVSREAICDYGATTGTTGPPVLLPATQADWDGMLDTVVRGVRQVGIGPGDTVQITVAFDQLFTVGIPLDLACKRAGAATARMGPGNTARQVQVLHQTRATWLISGAQYLLALGAEAAAAGLDPKRDLAVKAAIVLAQPVRGPGWRPNALHERIAEMWDIPLFSDYGSMEVYAGFFDCPHFGGHHTYWDRHVVEVLDPETLDPVPDGEVGELVFTHLGAEAMPLVPFRQGDLSRIETHPCSCGRTAPRIMEILGRTDEMLKIKDVSVYPRQIEDAIMQVRGVELYVVEVEAAGAGREQVHIRLAAAADPEVVAAQVRDRVKAQARITPLVTIAAAGDIAAIHAAGGTRKAKTFWDRRPR